MEITQQRVVTIHYTLTNDAGEVLDSSRGAEPLAYLHGAGNIIPGLENALAGKRAGDKLSVRVEPAQGYGERDDRLVQHVPRRAFQGIAEIQPGMSFHAESSNGPMRVTVTRVAGDMVTVDGNHPLAGEPLNFDVEVADVRAATEEELSHGHVHGPGGHHH
jgi:FKBP-type peptidyl-prolyl cis-trans isomerase SlyD